MRIIYLSSDVCSSDLFLYFTSFKDPDLAKAVREGRRNEFAALPAFSSQDARNAIPDPNDLQTWEQSKVFSKVQDLQGKRWREIYQTLLAMRRQFISTHIDGAASQTAQVVGPCALWASRSEERRIGEGGVSTCRSRWSQYP